ncbi:MAG: bifunctional diguanylate cyclase/phosphodiesterase, partial [Propionibacteriaceae bacterium]|nr:bifunctional diguanylate cyclase/phosphodiesterase [Propionibacteriaceae bacterium]
ARIGTRSIFAGIIYATTWQAITTRMDAPVIAVLAATAAYVLTTVLLWNLPTVLAGEDPAVLFEHLIPTRIFVAFGTTAVLVLAAGFFDPLVHEVLVRNPGGLKLVIGLAVATSLFSAVGFLVYSFEARKRLDGLISTAESLPWPDDPEPMQQMTSFAGRTLQASLIEVRSSPPQARTEIGAPFHTPSGEMKYLVAKRDRGRSPLLDRDFQALSAIAHIGQETMRVRGEANELRTEANTDPLTGLFNYRGFQVAINDVNSRRGDQGGVAIIYIDLDGFKAINDRYGHSAGNEILQVVAHRLSEAVRPRDAVARVGGDEFVVLLRDITDEGHAEQVAHRIIDLASSPVVLDDVVVAVSLSAGVSFAPTGEGALEELVNEADSRMYAKRGRQLPSVPGLAGPGRMADAQTSKRSAAIADLIRNRELRVEYQPIVDAGRGVIAALEALVRADHPTYGLIPSPLLVREASRLGLLDSLTQQVLDRTFADLEQMRRVAPGLRDISVNIELGQLAHPEIRDHMLELCRQYPGVRLTMEITENSLNNVSEEVSRELDELRAGGLRLALDDFGQGYSTMLAIAQVPFDALKIDRSLIANIATSRKSRQVIASMAKLCRSLHVRMVVEGVERHEEREVLQRLGVRYMQGFLFSKSETAADLCEQFASAGLAIIARQPKGLPAGAQAGPGTEPEAD